MNILFPAIASVSKFVLCVDFEVKHLNKRCCFSYSEMFAWLRKKVFKVFLFKSIITAFLLFFLPPNSLINPSPPSFKLKDPFPTNCYYIYMCMCIYVYIPTDNSFSPDNVACIDVCRTFPHWTTNWCAFPWGRPLLLLPAFPSCLQFIVEMLSHTVFSLEERPDHSKFESSWKHVPVLLTQCNH